MKTAVVTTTINVPKLLQGYAKSVRRYRHLDTHFVVVGDKKTPSAAKSFCARLEKRSGVPIHFFDLKQQEDYLKKYPELNRRLPYNSIQRRNIGILFAYEKGAESIVTIDDDNFFIAGDFLGEHALPKEKVPLEVFSSGTGWLNVCGFLKEKNGFSFYHRGFPMKKRWLKEKLSSRKKSVKVVANAGFWLGDPDIDAITRLTLPVDVSEFKRRSNFALDIGTWSPFNSQNTALSREVIPAYFLSPDVGRYDDIWASYVIKRIADHLGHYISFGKPLVYQERNPHNYFKDYEKEKHGMALSDLFCDWLKSIRLKGSDYSKCYRELYLSLQKKLKAE